MCSSNIISSLLWFSCQSESPASQGADAKCLVCTSVRHVFLAESVQVCHFPKCKASRSPFPVEDTIGFGLGVSARVGAGLALKAQVGSTGAHSLNVVWGHHQAVGEGGGLGQLRDIFILYTWTWSSSCVEYWINLLYKLSKNVFWKSHRMSPFHPPTFPLSHLNSQEWCPLFISLGYMVTRLGEG